MYIYYLLSVIIGVNLAVRISYVSCHVDAMQCHGSTFHVMLSPVIINTRVCHVHVISCTLERSKRSENRQGAKHLEKTY